MITEQKKWSETPIFIVRKQLGPDNNPYLDQIITPEPPQLGPENNFSQHIYIYTHTYVHTYPHWCANKGSV